jgi:hypothetical protein
MDVYDERILDTLGRIDARKTSELDRAIEVSFDPQVRSALKAKHQCLNPTVYLESHSSILAARTESIPVA